MNSIDQWMQWVHNKDFVVYLFIDCEKALNVVNHSIMFKNAFNTDLT